MSDDQKHPERRSSLDGRFAPAMSNILHRLLVEMPAPFPCRYACFIHPRRRTGEQGFGVITLEGESLPLSVEMLASLEQVATFLVEKRALVVVSPADPADVMIPNLVGRWSAPQPVPRFLMKMHPVADENQPGGDAEMRADNKDWPQVTLLCASRPRGVAGVGASGSKGVEEGRRASKGVEERYPSTD